MTGPFPRAAQAGCASIAGRYSQKPQLRDIRPTQAAIVQRRRDESASHPGACQGGEIGRVNRKTHENRPVKPLQE